MAPHIARPAGAFLRYAPLCGACAGACLKHPFIWQGSSLLQLCFCTPPWRGAFLFRATGVNPWDNERTSVSAGEPRLVAPQRDERRGGSAIRLQVSESPRCALRIISPTTRIHRFPKIFGTHVAAKTLRSLAEEHKIKIQTRVSAFCARGHRCHFRFPRRLKRAVRAIDSTTIEWRLWSAMIAYLLLRLHAWLNAQNF